jgi:hypothetical protein
MFFKVSPGLELDMTTVTSIELSWTTRDNLRCLFCGQWKGFAVVVNVFHVMSEMVLVAEACLASST